MSAISVVVATRNRREQLLAGLHRHEAPVIVVDNGSTDGTSAAVRQNFPGVRVIRLDRNAGAAARTIGVRAARTEYVAFADDDSYWAPGQLAAAGAVLDAHPSLALVCARVLVGEAGRLDPVSAFMADAPLGRVPGLPGPSILGFLACAVAVRRSAFLDVGGFVERLGTYGEEELVALELAAAGWDMAYVDDLVVHHHPQPGRANRRRDALQIRNGVVTSMLRRSLSTTGHRVGQALRSPAGRRGLMIAAGDLVWALRHRRPVPAGIERAARLIDP